MREPLELRRSVTLDANSIVDGDAFQRLIEPYRRELHVHCYRMLGSLQDAEDLTQETLLRAWRGRDGFEGRSSVRTWLYRIATNLCLNTLAKRASVARTLPELSVAPTDDLPGPMPITEHPWLDPYPDSALEGIIDTAPGPAARYEMRESIQLAFVAAIQSLPPRQRAVLLLRDVLGWSASETAGLLDSSVAAANSALQRARATLETRFPSGEPTSLPTPDDEQRAVLDRYLRTWEGADLDGFVALLRDDATLSMPPLPNWYRGRAAVRRFLAWVLGVGPDGAHRPRRQFRVLLTGANGQPAFASYMRAEGDAEWRSHSIQVLSIVEGKIAALVTFREPRVLMAFGLPDTLPDDSAQ